MGGNIYGVQQASKYYFNKNVSDLNLVEAAQIAGMFQSPNGYNPYVNPNDANERKNTVLYLMKRHGYITEDEYKAGTQVEIKDLLRGGTTSVNVYQGFIDTVVQEVIDDTGNNPYDVPMDIYSTMVKSKQDIINNFYKTYKFKDSKIEIGIGVINNKTGAIIAVGAGRNKTSAMTLNVATFSGQTKRMPGSTAKPILDYGPAIEYSNLSSYGPFVDGKVPYGGGHMRNFNGGYSGFMTMRDCLKKSINTCALQAFRLTTNEEKKEFAAKLGVEFKEEVLPDSYSIGAFNGVSPVQLASAYSAFGNNGKRSTPHSYTKIVYRETDEVVTKNVITEQVMKPTTAYMIANILTGATTSKVRVSGTQVATKTGTTSYDTGVLRKYGLTSSVIPDSWTSSFTTDYAMAIWLGYTDGLSKDNVKHKWYLKNGYASTERLNIQAKLANKIYEKNSKFKNPGGLTSAKVELETFPAQSPSAYTPSNLTGTFLFVGNTGPSETSPRFEKLTDPSAVTYSLSSNAINLSWTSPGTPSAIDTNYLTKWFNDSWKIEPDKYLKERLKYNKSKIGNFGFAIYLTQGSSSTYVGWTQDTSYTIDTTKFNGIYDGVIVKSQYSIFKSNASSGYKVVFNYIPSGENIDEADVTVNMNNTNVVLNVGDTFKELTSSNITSIKYKGVEIKNNVTNLSVITSSVSGGITPNQITSTAGTYTITYTVSFVYSGKSITKTITQNVTVQ
jgi:penicillin-binding protein 1A